MADLTTKELFELAKILSDTFDEITDSYKNPWEDLSRLDQVGWAEGIRAVVEELERRGWVNYSEFRQRYVPASPAQRLDKLVGDTLNTLTEYGVWDGCKSDFHQGEGQCSATPELDKAFEWAKANGPWDRWEDVPQGVVVSDRVNEFKYRKVGEDVYVVTPKGREFQSAWDGSDPEFDSYHAPFIRVGDK